MSRTVSWFSCGAASAVATKLSKPDVIAYCETGAEHPDNKRFMVDCEKWFGQKIIILQNPQYADTWAVWEKRKYISGINGAPCTGLLKVAPRLVFEERDDTNIFGYTADGPDIHRAQTLIDNWPDIDGYFPLIERGITKAGCLAMIEKAGIKPPVTYAMGFPNANCIPCCKATSPAYWALVRKHFPAEFERMAILSRKLNVKLSRINGERVFIDEIPTDHPVTQPLAPECDFLCSLADKEMNEDEI